MKTIYLACFAFAMAYGQTGSLAKPSIGFVFDSSTKSLRPIQGLPGAAVVGAPIEFGFVLSSTHVAPRLDSAFIRAADDTPHFFRLSGSALTERPVADLASFVQVVYSPLGSAAALLSAGKIQVIKGLPDAPVVAATISPRANPRNRRPLPDAIAISDDGAYLLYAAGGPVELLSVAGDSRQVLDGGPGTLAAFAPGSHDATVIQSGKLYIFNDIAGSATHRTVDSAATPSDLAYSPDSRSLLIASAAGRSVTTLNLETGERSSVACDCAPATLTPMGSVFRLNELGKDPLWLLDPAAGRGLIFVPAPANN
jgi:hypothetical protein